MKCTPAVFKTKGFATSFYWVVVVKACFITCYFFPSSNALISISVCGSTYFFPFSSPITLFTVLILYVIGYWGKVTNVLIRWQEILSLICFSQKGILLPHSWVTHLDSIIRQVSFYLVEVLVTLCRTFQMALCCHRAVKILYCFASYKTIQSNWKNFINIIYTMS